MSSMRNAVQRRNHKERSQPQERQKWGILEKKKDYVLRARDYNAKKSALKALRSKASARNPDEFYFAMTTSRTRDGGIKVSSRADDVPAMSVDVARLLKTQDAGYVRTQAAVERRAVEKLEAGLGFMQEGKDARGLAGRHTVFVETEEEAREFRPEVYFGTHKELVERRFNRPRMGQLVEVGMAGGKVEGGGDVRRRRKGGDTEEKKMAKRREGKYKELEGRMKRAAELKVAERALELQRARMGKGSMVGKNKWARVRSR